MNRDNTTANSLPTPAAITVSAVITNYNGGEKVVTSARCLVAQTVAFAEIIIVDNGSTDGSTGKVKAACPSVVVHETGANNGLPFARNQGLSRAQGDLVLMVDADVYLEPDCLERLLQAYSNHQPAVLCPRIRLIPERDIVQADGAAGHFLGTMTLRHAYTPVTDLDNASGFVDGCIGACMLLERAAVIDAGGFDELYFFYFEDLEFCLRMRTLGKRIYCEPRAVVYHDRGAGTPGLSFRGRGTYPRRRIYLSTRHRIVTMLVHYRLRTLLILAPVLVLYECVGFLSMIPRRGVLAWGRAWMWQFANFGEIRRRRHQIQSTRCLSDRELLSGGPIPLAPGFINSRIIGILVNGLSSLFNGYWRVVQRLIA